MKRIGAAALLLAGVLCLAGCSEAAVEKEEPARQETEEVQNEETATQEEKNTEEAEETESEKLSREKLEAAGWEKARYRTPYGFFEFYTPPRKTWTKMGGHCENSITFEEPELEESGLLTGYKNSHYDPWNIWEDNEEWPEESWEVPEGLGDDWSEVSNSIGMSWIGEDLNVNQKRQVLERLHVGTFEGLTVWDDQNVEDMFGTTQGIEGMLTTKVVKNSDDCAIVIKLNSSEVEPSDSNRLCITVLAKNTAYMYTIEIYADGYAWRDSDYTDEAFFADDHYEAFIDTIKCIIE